MKRASPGKYLRSIRQFRPIGRREVPHYWILDPDGKTLSVLRWHADGYLLVAAVSPGDAAALEPFDAVELEVRTLFGDLEEEPET